MFRYPCFNWLHLTSLFVATNVASHLYADFMLVAVKTTNFNNYHLAYFFDKRVTLFR